VSENGPAIK